GHADDLHPLAGEALGDAEGPVAPDGDEGVQAEGPEVPHHLVRAVLLDHGLSVPHRIMGRRTRPPRPTPPSRSGTPCAPPRGSPRSAPGQSPPPVSRPTRRERRDAMAPILPGMPRPPHALIQRDGGVGWRRFRFIEEASMSAPAFVERPARLGLRAAAALAFLPPLVTRITLGHAFFLTGRGKLANFDTFV